MRRGGRWVRSVSCLVSWFVLLRLGCSVSEVRIHDLGESGRVLRPVRRCILGRADDTLKKRATNPRIWRAKAPRRRRGAAGGRAAPVTGLVACGSGLRDM